LEEVIGNVGAEEARGKAVYGHKDDTAQEEEPAATVVL
jgi:hypothetical protein